MGTPGTPRLAGTPGLPSRDTRTPGRARLSERPPGADGTPAPAEDGAPTSEMQHVVGDGDVRVLREEEEEEEAR